MKFLELKLDGAYVIDLEPHEDGRGFFSRLFCAEEFAELGLETKWLQINNSYTKGIGTLRGLHFQLNPYEETKVIRCIRGKIWDVIVDLRLKSKTYGQWYGQELSNDNRSMMYVPKGFAHGFVSLTDESEIIYFVSQNYNKEYERTLLWIDQSIAIVWPVEIQHISEKDISGKSLAEIKNDILTKS